MWRHRWAVLAATISTLFLASAPAHAQRPGGMMGMGGGMMCMGHDSATMAQMVVIHELMLNHDRMTRTVTNLSDGIRTVTESDDPLMARRIKEHVATMNQRVVARDDPGLPMESTALHAIYRSGDKIRTRADTTARGIVVVQTSSDAATVAALQQHASEVSELVRRGMVAMHDAMMKKGGMMQGGMPCRTPADTAATAHAGHAGGTPDSAFAARGGELRIRTKDPAALKAIAEFLKFQRENHHAAGMDHGKMPR